MRIKLSFNQNAVTAIDDMLSIIRQIADNITIVEGVVMLFVECDITVAYKVIQAIAHYEK